MNSLSDIEEAVVKVNENVKQSFERNILPDVDQVRKSVLEARMKRVRPCLIDKRYHPAGR